jgi:hypothetical protein
VNHATFVAVLLAIGMGSSDAVAQAGAESIRATGVVDGVVTDTSLTPVADATVSVVGMELRVVTGANGRFRVLSVPAGDYVLLVRRIGYEATTAKITVAARDTLRLSFALQPAVATLDTVNVAARSVSPRLAEFYERRKVGPGQFMTQDEIEKQNAVRASDLFGRFLGLRITSDGRGAFSLRDTPAHPCPVAAVVDGIARDTNFGSLPSPKEIAAIEFFAGPSEIPLQYKTTRRNTWCGLILIWTRDGSQMPPRPAGLEQ